MTLSERATIETLIEGLIALLDADDGDPDLEGDELESDGDDEDYDVEISA